MMTTVMDFYSNGSKISLAPNWEEGCVSEARRRSAEARSFISTNLSEPRNSIWNKNFIKINNRPRYMIEKRWFWGNFNFLGSSFITHLAFHLQRLILLRSQNEENYFKPYTNCLIHCLLARLGVMHGNIHQLQLLVV